MQRPRCAADLTTLGTQVCGLAVRALLPLLSSTPAPRREARSDAAIPDGMVQLMAKLGMGRLPVLTDLALSVMPVGNAGSSALGAAAGPRRPAAAQGPRTVRRRHRQRGLVCPRAGLAKASRAGGYWSFVQPVRRRGRRRPPSCLAPPPARGRQVRCRRRPRQVQVRCRRQRSGWRSSLC